MAEKNNHHFLSHNSVVCWVLLVVYLFPVMLAGAAVTEGFNWARMFRRALSHLCRLVENHKRAWIEQLNTPFSPSRLRAAASPHGHMSSRKTPYVAGWGCQKEKWLGLLKA